MRSLNRLKHGLERFIVKGAGHQLLLVAALIGLISIIGGGLIRLGTADGGSMNESVWWAFLRLTDPGYLGDDTGTLKRIVSTAITVLGYVLFMGSLVAILTQWLNSTIRTLERGLTPIARNNHVVVIGWSERVGTVVRDLFHSEGRVRRFLHRRGAKRLHIVVLSEDAGPSLLEEIRLRVGARRWNAGQVTLRSGSALRGDHLSRVDFLHAAAVILPAGDFSRFDPQTVDTHTVKALLSMSNHPAVDDPSQLPLAVAEVVDARKIEIARAAYRGPAEVIAADTVIARLLAQNLRHQGLSYVYTELLTHGEGNGLFIRGFPDLAGSGWSQIPGRFATAVPLGLLRKDGDRLVSLLNPAATTELLPGDLLVLMARDYEATGPNPRAVMEAAEGEDVEVETGSVGSCRKVLILGWNHKIPALLEELAGVGQESYALHIASVIDPTKREHAIASYLTETGGIEVSHSQLDYTVPSEMQQIAPSGYDNVVLMSSDRMESGEEADARTIVGYLLLQRVLATVKKRPHVIVEILDPANVELLGRRRGEVLISPEILSHMLGQIALRRELNAVFDDLFASGATEITFIAASGYSVNHDPAHFAALQDLAMARGQVLLGFLPAGDRPLLNPPPTAAVPLGDGDELIVLKTHAH